MDQKHFPPTKQMQKGKSIKFNRYFLKKFQPRTVIECTTSVNNQSIMPHDHTFEKSIRKQHHP